MIQIRKIGLAILLLVLGLSFFLPTQTAAATTEMYVYAKNDIFLRTKPNQHADKLGTIKNHSKVTVLSSSNGWSLVQTGKNKGYVYTSALSKKEQKAVPTTVTGNLTPAEGLILTYAPSFLDDQKETFFAKKEEEYTYLYNKNSSVYPYLSNLTYIEDNERLLMGVSSSDFIFLNVSYPLKQGAYTKNQSFMAEEKVLVESTTKTITVKAGSFRNVVILRFPDGSRVYLAKGNGVIKSTDGNGKITIELASVKQEK